MISRWTWLKEFILSTTMLRHAGSCIFRVEWRTSSPEKDLTSHKKLSRSSSRHIGHRRTKAYQSWNESRRPSRLSESPSYSIK